jgi:hypothetical protein
VDMCFLNGDPPKSIRKERQTCPPQYCIMVSVFKDINMFIPRFTVAPFISGCDKRSTICAARSVVPTRSRAEAK